MKKSGYALFFLLAVFVAVTVVFLQKEPAARQEYLVGVVNPNPGTQDIGRGFMDGLREYLHAEGKAVSFVLAEKPEACDVDQCLHTFVEKKTDLIFAVTTPAVKRAKDLTQNSHIPVIFSMYDPVDSGIIKSLAQPGGSLTGIQIRAGVSKALELFLAVVPEVKHLFIPITLDTKAAEQSLDDLGRAAELLDVKLTVAEVNSLEELDAALASMPEDVGGVFLLHSIFIAANSEKIVEAATAKKLPVGASISQCEKGAIAAFSLDQYHVGKQASRLAHRVLQGEAAGDIPTEIAEYFFGINLKAAAILGIDISNEILQQADYIVR